MAVLNHVIGRLDVGGAERMLLKLLNTRRDRSPRDGITCLQRGGTLLDEVRRTGHDVTSLEVTRDAAGLARGAMQAWRGRDIWRESLFQGWMYHGNLAATLLARIATSGLPHFWSIRCSLDHIDYLSPETRALIRLSKLLSRQPAAIIYNSNLAAQQHAAAGFAAEKARVIPNGFDLDVFCPDPGRKAAMRARMGIGEDAVVVLHVARFNPVKGHREFIAALGTILPENPRMLGVMVGKEVDERNSQLMVQIRRSNAVGQIMLLAGLPESPVGLDMGCGSGGWARFVAPRVGTLHCVDASPEAVEVARRNLALHTNCHVATGTFGDNQLQPESLDFAYCLGVVHHTPDPAAAIASIVPLLKPGAPLLLYIYYALDNRPLWYRSIWRMSDRLRRVICRLPFPLRSACAEMVAFSVYWPLARAAAVGERLGARVEDWPLAFYRDKQLYVLRTDALDRLGTRLEHRFTRAEIAGMLKWAGLENLVFSDAEPFWVVLGRRSPAPGKNGSIICAE